MSTMPSVLEDIIARTRARLRETPPDLAALEALALTAPPPRDALEALSKGPQINAIIAEVKRRSPSLGALKTDADAVATASTYASSGAAAISVLTEPERFGGRFEDLAQVSAAVVVPTLCKDFIVDPRQVLTARAHGASLVLLIVAALNDEALVSLRRDIEALGMVALVEVHDEAELDRALATGARLIGVNNRSLHTLHIDLAVSERLRPRIPDDRLPISESGVSTPADILRLRDAGFHRFLIGSSLMTASDPGALLAELVHATRPSASRP
jgi:indole-3-glycerol phosphate synthase